MNTGWTGGRYGVGSRMKIGFTRALVNAVLDGSLGKAGMRIDPVFAFQGPSKATDVPSVILNPRNTWARASEYDVQAKKLFHLFHKNFEQFKDQSPDNVIPAGPKKED